MSKPIFKLTVYPAIIKAPSVGHSYTLLVRDSGTAPITVHVTPEEISRNQANVCVLGNHAVAWAAASPASFTLKPDQTKSITVKLLPGKESGGVHDLTVISTSALPGTGTVHINESVGAQALYTAPGTVTSTQEPCIQLASPSSGFNALDFSVGLGAFALVLIALFVIIRRRLRK